MIVREDGTIDSDRRIVHVVNVVVALTYLGEDVLEHVLHNETREPAGSCHSSRVEHPCPMPAPIVQGIITPLTNQCGGYGQYDKQVR